MSPLHSSCAGVSVESAVVLEEGSTGEMELREAESPAESPESEDVETSCSEHVLSEERFGKAQDSYSRVRRGPGRAVGDSQEGIVHEFPHGPLRNSSLMASGRMDGLGGFRGKSLFYRGP